MVTLRNKTFLLSAMNKGGRAALARSRSIDHQIDEERERRQKEIQILILGSAGAGKSTFIKQLRLHYGDHFAEHARQEFVQYVMYNVACALHVILDQMELMDIKFDNDQNKAMAQQLRELHPRMSLDAILKRYKEEEDRCTSVVPPMKREDVRRRLTLLDVYVPLPADTNLLSGLWADSGVQCCYARRHKFENHVLSSTSGYFLENLDRILIPGYMPSVQDVLYIRWPTLGMQEHVFNVEHLHFKVIDVAGQKSLRKKWIHFFEGVTAVMFFVALSGFDQSVEEEPNVNMLQDSLQAFREVSHNHFLERTDFILFLNKKDIFVKHLQTSSLKTCFKHYKGPPQGVDECLKYVKDQFVQNKPGPKQMYTHVICCVNVSHMRDVLVTVMGKLVDINVKRTQLQ